MTTTSQVDHRRTAERRGVSRYRTAVAGVLIALAAISTVSAVVSLWANDTLYDEEIMVAAFADLPDDPDRAAAMGEWIASQVVETLAVEERLSVVLPFGVSLFSGLLADGVEDIASAASRQVIQTELFSEVWIAALPVAHRAMVALLDGSDEGAVTAVEGVITVDVSAAVVAAYERVAELVPDINDDGVIARITGLQAGQAKAAVGDLLTSVVPDDLGSIVLFESAALASLQGWEAQLNQIVWLSILAVVVAASAAVVMAPRPYPAFVVAGVTIAVAMVVGAGVVTGAEWALINAVADLPTSSGGVGFGTFLDGWQGFIVLTLIAAIVLGVAGGIIRLRRPAGSTVEGDPHLG